MINVQPGIVGLHVQAEYSSPVMDVFVAPIANTPMASSTNSHSEITDNSRDPDKSSEG